MISNTDMELKDALFAIAECKSMGKAEIYMKITQAVAAKLMIQGYYCETSTLRPDDEWLVKW